MTDTPLVRQVTLRTAGDVMANVQVETLARDQVRALLAKAIEEDRTRRAGRFEDLHAYRHTIESRIFYTVVQIDTTGDDQDQARIYVNDGYIFDGDPITAADEMRQLVQQYDNDEPQGRPYGACEWMAEGHPWVHR
ncbi:MULTISPECIES: hypothetical protein [unclassified Microbacterium]|uniref:hypothetical protein n=1 Tax=Microbacterium sp. CIAB417 TaxID=2860287 RepID=UPI001FAE59E3|nr:hypothetical protein [Microbacterium sp. CIAB417]